MSRTLKRVPQNFSWPLKKVWGGYLNPYYAQCSACPDCENGCDRVGGRPDANAALFYAQWYGNAPFDPIAYGAESISPDNPAILDHARHNVDTAPDFYMAAGEQRERLKFRQAAMDGFPGEERALVPFPAFEREAAITREAERLYETCFRDHWKHHLIQADVDALVTKDRLWDFTRTPINDEQREVVRKKLEAGENSWLPYDNGHRPTAAEVNAWSLGGFAHDGLNTGVCVEARCKRERVPYMCARCEGSGRIWPTPEIEQRCEDWEKEHPPTGDGYQLWEDCSEGSPVSPVFASFDELCCWCAEHATTFAHFKATKEEWRTMLEDDCVHAKVEGGILL